jgi:hypothetical protein
MRRILAAVCLFLGATGAMGQVITSLNPPSFMANSGEWFLTANGRYVGDTFVYNGPAGTFKVDATAIDTTFSTAWVPLEVLAKPGTYTLTVEGPNGATDPVSFKVNSVMRVPNLTLVLPETLIAAARTTKGAYVKYNVSVFGGNDSSPTVKCDPESGAFFNTGTNRVSCTASNSLGETASDVFTISVIDDAPTIKLPYDIVVPPDSDRGTFVKYDISAYDDVDARAVPVSCKPASGELFPVGLTFVECNAADSVGNVASASFTVNVTDEKQP